MAQKMHRLFDCVFILLLCNDLLSLLAVEGNFVYRSYQTSIYCNASREIQTPVDVSALRDLVAESINRGQTVKAFGSRHSISDVICTEGVPISMENINYARLNTDGSATFGAGIKLDAAMQFLESNNLTLIHVPTFAGISIGGAIGTGAHGSSLRHPTSLSDQVVRMSALVGNGSQIDVSGPQLDHFRVHLGLLGVVVDVTFQPVPLFKMTIKNEVKGDSVLFDGSIPSAAYSQDMYQLWWFPQTKRVVIGTGQYVSKATLGNAVSNFIPNSDRTIIAAGSTAFELLQKTRNTPALQQFASFTELSLHTDVIGKAPIYTEDGKKVVNPATGYAWRLQSNNCNSGTNSRCTWLNDDRKSIYVEESSMAFALSQFTGVMTMMQKIIKAHPAAFALVGIYVRFSKASPATMAISTGRDTFTIEWTTPLRQNPYDNSRDAIGTYQAILQEMVTNYGGRPHWGKNGLYYTTQEILRRAVPNREQFASAMQTYDPNGTFMNAFGRRIIGVSDAQVRDPEVTRCALQDYCTCRQASDCGVLQRCGQINGFPVCMDDLNLMGTVTRAIDLVFPDLYNLPQMLNVVLAPVKAILPISIF